MIVYTSLNKDDRMPEVCCSFSCTCYKRLDPGNRACFFRVHMVMIFHMLLDTVWCITVHMVSDRGVHMVAPSHISPDKKTFQDQYNMAQAVHDHI